MSEIKSTRNREKEKKEARTYGNLLFNTYAHNPQDVSQFITNKICAERYSNDGDLEDECNEGMDDEYTKYEQKITEERKKEK